MKQKNTIINITLILISIAVLILAYLTYLNWQQSTPPTYTPVTDATDARYVVQLQDHVGQPIYTEIKEVISEDLSQDIGYTTIRPNSYTKKADQVTFLSDISGTSATYRFNIDLKNQTVNIACPTSQEKRDPSWTCGLAHTGDRHVH